jgi:hypothetical protein
VFTDLSEDVVSLYLLWMIGLLIGLPSILLIAWRVTRPPFRIASFRWLYLAWVCLLVSASVWTISRQARFSVEEAGADNYTRLAFLGLGILVILAVGAAYRFAFFSELGTGALGIFFLFSVWGLASTVWSVSPAGTLYKASEYCAMLALFALAASLINVTIKNPKTRFFALKSVFDFNWFLVFALIASAYAGILIFPEQAFTNKNVIENGVLSFSLQGVIPGISNNALGQLGAVMGIVAVARLLQRPQSGMLWVPVLAISLLTMVLAESRSPILAFFVAVFLLMAANRRFWLLIPSGALLGAAALWQYGQLTYDFMRRGQSDENLANLTGRVGYWQASIDALREKLLEGYGANVGGRHVLQDALAEKGATTVHSTWVEVLLDTGAVGIVLFAAGLLATWFWLFRLRSDAIGDPIGRLLWFECLGVLAVLSVRSVFSVAIVWSFHVLTFGVVLVFLVVMRRQAVEARHHAGTSGAQPVPTARRRRPSIRG